MDSKRAVAEMGIEWRILGSCLQAYRIELFEESPEISRKNPTHPRLWLGLWQIFFLHFLSEKQSLLRDFQVNVLFKQIALQLKCLHLYQNCFSSKTFAFCKLFLNKLREDPQLLLENHRMLHFSIQSMSSALSTFNCLMKKRIRVAVIFSQ